MASHQSGALTEAVVHVLAHGLDASAEDARIYQQDYALTLQDTGSVGKGRPRQARASGGTREERRRGQS